MSGVTQALNVGHTAKQILDYLIRSDKKNGSKIKKALDAGHSPEEIIEYLKASYPTSKLAKKEGYKPFSARLALPQGMTEQERASLAGKRQGPSLGGIAKQAAPLLAAGLAGFGAARGAGLVSNLIGGYLGRLGQGGTPSPAPPSGPLPPSPPSAPPSGPLPPSPPSVAPTAPSAAIGTAASLIPQIFQIFGIRNKPLVNAVTNIVKETGEDVRQVYNELSAKADISTPEKATKAALNRLDEIRGAEARPTTVREIKEQAKARKEKMGTIKTIEQIKKDFAKDLKSSVIRKTVYDGDTSTLKVIFNNDHTYDYSDVPKGIYDDLTKGGVPAKTEGKNQYGVWWVGKKPSLGASFNKLIKQGGYEYAKGPNTPLAPQEKEEFEELQKPFKKHVEKFLKTEKKIGTATRKDHFRGEVKKPLTEEQRKLRVTAMTRELEGLKSKPMNEKSKEMIAVIEERLKNLKELDILQRKSKGKVLIEELARIEKADGEKMLKKLMVLLPKAIAQVVKEKIAKTSEKDVLTFIKDYLLTRK